MVPCKEELFADVFGGSDSLSEGGVTSTLIAPPNPKLDVLCTGHADLVTLGSPISSCNLLCPKPCRREFDLLRRISSDGHTLKEFARSRGESVQYNNANKK